MKALKHLSQIATKKGDDGESRDYAGNVHPKNDPLFECLGTIDELSSSLGLSYHYCHEPSIKHIQRILQKIASLVATPAGHTLREKIDPVTEDDIAFLETSIQHELDAKDIEPVFALPGSEQSKRGAHLNMSRAVTRRCERVFAGFIAEKDDPALNRALSFLNRLSDYLYVLAHD